MKDFQIMGNRILIQMDANTESIGGIYIPDTVKIDAPKWGTVVSVTTGWFVNGVNICTNIEEGDRVLIDGLGAIQLKLEGKEYVIVRTDDIIGTVPKEEKTDAV